MSKILHFLNKPLTFRKRPPLPFGASVEQPPKRWFDFRLWLVVLALLVGYPAYAIWMMMPFYADVWAVVDILLAVFSVFVGLQLLNRRPAALRNTKLLFVLYSVRAITAYVWFHVMGDGWENANLFAVGLLRVGLIWLPVLFSQRGRALFPDVPLRRRNPWHFFKRYFVDNPIGQIVTYGVIVLLVVAVITTPADSTAMSSIDGSSMSDSVRESETKTWLVENPDNLKQLMESLTGVHPILKNGAPATKPLDAKTIYEQQSPAVVLIYTNDGVGAGFLLTADGVVVTSQHVLDGAKNAVVSMKSRELFSISSILSCDKDKDYCLFKIDVTDAPFVTLGDPSTVEVGDPVTVIGHPYGNYYSLSNGLISKIHEYPEAGTLFQFTAPASPGNSGGPVFNEFGQVIGIARSIFDSNDAQNLNYAMSVSSLRDAISL